MYNRNKKPTFKPANDVIYTPDWVADEMVKWCDLTSNMTILEPACGNGSLLRAIGRYVAKEDIVLDSVSAFEIDENVQVDCGELNCHIDIRRGNFFKYAPDKHYDVVIMNPPFGDSGCEKFLKVVLNDWLSKSGTVVMIVPASFLNNSERRKEWLRRYLWIDGILPKNTFRDSGVPVFHTDLLQIGYDAMNRWETLYLFEPKGMA